MSMTSTQPYPGQAPNSGSGFGSAPPPGAGGYLSPPTNPMNSYGAAGGVLPPGGYRDLNTPTSNVPTQPGMSSIDYWSPTAVQDRLSVQAAPQFTNFNNIYGNLQNRLGLYDQQYNNQAGQLQGQYGLDTQTLANKQATNAVDQGQAGRLPDYYNQLNASNQAGLKAQYDMYGNLITNAAGQQAIQAQASQQLSAKGIREMKSNAIAQGATGSMGAVAQYGENKATLANQLAMGQNTFEQSQEIYQRRQEGLQKQMDSGNITTAEQVKNAQDTQAKLGIVAQQYGVDGQTLSFALSKGLTNLGISHAISINDILTAVQSNDVQKNMLAMQIVQQALATSASAGWTPTAQSQANALLSSPTTNPSLFTNPLVPGPNGQPIGNYGGPTSNTGPGPGSPSGQYNQQPIVPGKQASRSRVIYS